MRRRKGVAPKRAVPIPGANIADKIYFSAGCLHDFKGQRMNWSWFITGSMKLKTTCGYSPRSIMAAARTKMGMSSFFGSLIMRSSLGFLAYM